MLTPEQRRTLEAWRAAPETPRQVALRAQIVLFLAAGASNRAVARALQTTLVTVLLWRKRFIRGGPQALLELSPGRGPRRRITSRKVQQIVDATRKRPPAGIKRWSVRALAQAQGISQGTVQRILDEYGIKPHLAGEGTKSTGPLTGIVGLYLNPPDRILAIALERQPPPLASPKVAVSPGTLGNLPTATANLLRAISNLESEVVGDSRWRPRQQAFLTFLRSMEREVPTGSIHLLVDRDGTYRQDSVQAWLKRRPRLKLHPPPPGGAWVPWVSYWFGQVSRRRPNLPASGPLEAAIQGYLGAHLAQPHPFAWPGARKKSLT
jgi:transposase